MHALVHIPPIIISANPPKKAEKVLSYVLSTDLLISRKPNFQVIKKE